MYLLKLVKVGKSYKLSGNKSIQVLKNINIVFNSGELVSIVGESGSGKSTLMNLIGGLDSNYSGELFVNGEDIKKFKKKQLDAYRKNTVGFVFQSFNLISHLSVLDNVTLAMTLSDVKRKIRIQKAKEILKDLGLENHIYKKPNQLSGGEKQRVEIARALINDPDIIIADEPTGSLDSKTTKQILKILKAIAKKGKLVIMVTHSQMVASSSDRLIKIVDGQIREDSNFTKSKRKGADIKEKSNSNKKNKNLNIINAVMLSLKNMKEKITRNMLLSIGGSIGIMGIILMLSLGNGVKTYFSTTMNSYVNPLVIEADMNSNDDETINLDFVTIQKPKINKEKAFEEEDIEKLSQIENVSNVEEGFTLISMGANSISYNGKGSSLMRLSTISSNITESNIQEGRLPEEGEILINKTVSDKLGEDIVGKKVSLNILINQKTVKTEFTVSGIYTSIDGDLSSILKSAFLNYSDLENIYSKNNSKLKPNVMYLDTTSEEYTSGIKEKIKELGYSGSSGEQMTSMFNQMISIITYVLSGVAGISLVVSAIMIMIVMYISVVERTKEIGIIKAIGARKKDIRRIFVCEAFLIGVFSGVIGIAFSYGLMRVINNMSNKMFNLNLVIIKDSYLIFGLCVSIVISMLSGLLPANRAAKLDPVNSLRRE